MGEVINPRSAYYHPEHVLATEDKFASLREWESQEYRAWYDGYTLSLEKTYCQWDVMMYICIRISFHIIVRMVNLNSMSLSKNLFSKYVLIHTGRKQVRQIWISNVQNFGGKDIFQLWMTSHPHLEKHFQVWVIASPAPGNSVSSAGDGVSHFWRKLFLERVMPSPAPGKGFPGAGVLPAPGNIYFWKRQLRAGFVPIPENANPPAPTKLLCSSEICYG